MLGFREARFAIENAKKQQNYSSPWELEVRKAQSIALYNWLANYISSQEAARRNEYDAAVYIANVLKRMQLY